MKAPSLFFELLSSLTNKQKKALIHFIQTPGINFSKEREVLLTAILKNSSFKQGDGPEILKKYPVGKSSWNLVKGSLIEVIRRYLFVVMAEESSFSNSITLIEYYASMKLTRNMNKAVTKISKPQKGGIDFNTHLVNYHIARVNLMNTKDNFHRTEFLLEMEKQLDLYFIQNKLLCKTEKLNRKEIIASWDSPETLKLPEDIDQRIESSIGGRLYFLLFQMYKETTRKSRLVWYEQIHTTMLNTKKSKLLTPDFFREIYNHLLNFCSREIRAGYLEFANSFLTHIDELEQKDLLTQSGKINVRYLQNIIVISIVAEDLRKARFYFNKFEKLIIGNQKKTLVLIKAILYLHENKFGKIQEKLTEQSHYESYDHYVVESLYIKNYIERKELGQVVTNKINILKQRLSRENLIPEGRKTYIKNFLNSTDFLVEELLKANSTRQREKIIAKEMKIAGCSPLDTAWFKSFKKRVAQEGYSFE